MKGSSKIAVKKYKECDAMADRQEVFFEYDDLSRKSHIGYSAGATRDSLRIFVDEGFDGDILEIHLDGRSICSRKISRDEMPTYSFLMPLDSNCEIGFRVNGGQWFAVPVDRSRSFIHLTFSWLKCKLIVFFTNKIMYKM